MYPPIGHLESWGRAFPPALTNRQACAPADVLALDADSTATLHLHPAVHRRLQHITKEVVEFVGFRCADCIERIQCILWQAALSQWRKNTGRQLSASVEQALTVWKERYHLVQTLRGPPPWGW